MNSSRQPRRFWTAKRFALSIIVFSIVASLGASSCSGPSAGTTSTNSNNSSKLGPNQPDSTVPASNPNNVAPASQPLPAAIMNTELKALNGKSFKLADYQGKVVIVNLWATWCGPCRDEIPELVKVSEEFRTKGVEVIGLTNEDPETDGEKVRNFVKQFNITYTIGWSDQSFALALMQGEIRNSIPQSFIISRDGRVVKRFVGYNRIETPAKLRKALEDVVNQKQG